MDGPSNDSSDGSSVVRRGKGGGSGGSGHTGGTQVDGAESGVQGHESESSPQENPETKTTEQQSEADDQELELDATECTDKTQLQNFLSLWRRSQNELNKDRGHLQKLQPQQLPGHLPAGNGTATTGGDRLSRALRALHDTRFKMARQASAQRRFSSFGYRRRVYSARRPVGLYRRKFPRYARSGGFASRRPKYYARRSRVFR